MANTDSSSAVTTRQAVSNRSFTWQGYGILAALEPRRFSQQQVASSSKFASAVNAVVAYPITRSQ